MGKPPVRQDPMAGVPADILPEVKEQMATRQKRRAKEQKEVRPKATYDLPLRLLEAVTEISEKESIAKSDLVALAIIRFVDAYRAGNLSLRELKKRTRSLRYEWKLEIPPEWR